MRPFEYGYVAGQNVKLSNMTGKQIEKCVLDETAADFLPEVERVMQTSGVDVRTSCENLMGITVLLPVYFIKSGRLTAVMNGQTGRIAVSGNRKKRSNPWIIEPLAYTALAAAATSYFTKADLYNTLLAAFMFACIFFSIMGEGRRSLIRRITLRSEAAKAKREKGELKIEEGKDILKNPYDNTPVFYEKNRRGEEVPVKIRFYTPARCLSIIIHVAVTVFLPLIIASVIQWINISDTSRDFMNGFRPQYGAAWYLFAGFIAIIYFARGVRKDVYNHPILYEAAPGRGKKIGTRASRKLSMLSVLGLKEQDENGKQRSLFTTLRMMGGLGVFLGIFFIVLLVGSIAAILA